MKKLWLIITFFAGSALTAQLIDNVQIDFPPSSFEWRLLFDSQNVPATSDEEEIDSTETSFKVFCHREFDALEIFAVCKAEKKEQDGEDEKQAVNMIKSLFPNHFLVSQPVVDVGSGQQSDLGEWAFSDGTYDIMHGYARSIDIGKDCTVLAYFTTGTKTEQNRHTWLQVMSQASLVQ